MVFRVGLADCAWLIFTQIMLCHLGFESETPETLTNHLTFT